MMNARNWRAWGTNVAGMGRGASARGMQRLRARRRPFRFRSMCNMDTKSEQLPAAASFKFSDGGG